MTLFQVQICMWCSRSSTKFVQPKPILEMLIWKMTLLSILFKVCSHCYGKLTIYLPKEKKTGILFDFSLYFAVSLIA